MNDIIITITNQCGMLYIEPDMRQVGSQYDNEAQRLVFTRPNEYAAMDLVLYFSPINQFDTVYAFNIEQSNEWKLYSSITKHRHVRFQIEFFANGEKREHSNITELRFRDSLTDGEGELPVPPSPTLEKSAFVSAEYLDYILTFYNRFGEAVGSVEIIGGTGGGSDMLWLPSVNPDGDISFARSSTTTPPTVQNIRGQRGEDGQPGKDGEPGRDGQDGRDGAPGQDGYTPIKGIDYFDGGDGADGADGKSAYELAVDAGFVGSIAEWLTSIKGGDGQDGQDGSDGANGKSAYELAVQGGFQGSQSEWLASLKGADGKDGKVGKDGEPGADGYTPIKGVDYFDGKDGEPGKDGKDGDKGDTGNTGPAGTAATIAVGTVTTGAPGTNAVVTNAGTSSAAVFNFTIPRGDPGSGGGGTGGGNLASWSWIANGWSDLVISGVPTLAFQANIPQNVRDSTKLIMVSVFDSQNVVSYTITMVPNNFDGNTYWTSLLSIGPSWDKQDFELQYYPLQGEFYAEGTDELGYMAISAITIIYEVV